MMKPFPLFFLLPILLTTCKPASEDPFGASTPASGTLKVAVANYPLHYFATRLGGASVEVLFPVPKDQDPAFWQPSDADIAEFQAADLILMNGATYSKWAEKVTLPASKLVDTSKAFASQFIEVRDEATHSHGPEGEHSHSGTAFTTWLDFQQAVEQVEAIAEALKSARPTSAAAVEGNLVALKTDLQDLHNRMLSVGKRANGAPLVASHPVYQYLARRYALNLKAVLWEPETVPDEKAMAELRAILTNHSAKWMVWEGEPASESVAKLEGLGVKSVVFDPSGNTPDKGDFLSVMKANVEALEKVFP